MSAASRGNGTILAITGLHGAGKTELSRCLQSLGWGFHATGDVIRDEARRRSIPQDFDGLAEVSQEFLREHQQEIIPRLAPAVLRSIREKGKAIVDGVKTTLEVSQLRALGFPVYVVGVLASRELRIRRLSARHRPDDPPTLAALTKRDDWELKGGLGILLGGCDYYFVNDHSMDQVKQFASKLTTEVKTEQ